MESLVPQLISSSNPSYVGMFGTTDPLRNGKWYTIGVCCRHRLSRGKKKCLSFLLFLWSDGLHSITLRPRLQSKHGSRHEEDHCHQESPIGQSSRLLLMMIKEIAPRIILNALLKQTLVFEDPGMINISWLFLFVNGRLFAHCIDWLITLLSSSWKGRCLIFFKWETRDDVDRRG
jgi:hypothetical protein